MILKFSQAVIEKLGHYVYCLIDPRNDEVFYIGKGAANRVFDHLSEAAETDTDTDKLNQIREIKAEGYYPKHYILRHGLENKEALGIESTLIDFARLCEGFNFKLKNLVRGRYSFDKGLKTAQDIVHFYDAKPIEIDDPCLIIIVNRLYWYGMSPEELYKIVHERWRLNRKRVKNIKYVLASYLGIVREVYLVNDWYDSPDERTGKVRLGFNGEVAEDKVREKYIDGSLDKYRSNGMPTLYVNC